MSLAEERVSRCSATQLARKPATVCASGRLPSLRSGSTLSRVSPRSPGNASALDVCRLSNCSVPSGAANRVGERSESDVTVSGGGTVYVFTLETPVALSWLDDNVHLEDWQWLGRGFAVEHGYVAPLVQGMVADGLRVEVL